MTEDRIIAQLRGIVSSSHVLDEADVMASYTTDWSGRFGGPALAVVRPGSTAEIAEVMKACTAEGVPVVPQGGNSGLVGGGVPTPTAERLPIVVSTRRLDHLGQVDHLSGQVTVGAGATLGDVQRHAAAAGWEYGVDLAARDSATIGGTVATNAGGIRVIANGMTRAQLVGIEAVLADGSVISHLGGMLKDNTGYDLASLLCGSEGTLGIITAVRLRLHRPADATSVGFIGVASYADALALVEVARSGGARVLAAEILDDTSMDRVCEAFNLPWPFRARVPFALLFELADGGDGSGFEVLAEHPFVLGDLIVALEARDRERLWQYREKQAEAFAELGVFHNLDVSVPLPRLAECAERLRAEAAAMPGVIAFGVFGHLADGNLHVAIVDGDPDSYGVDRAVLECVARFEGSISAEHGVGRVKAAELHLCRTPAEIGAMRAIKAALDPAGLMNPGVIFR